MRFRGSRSWLRSNGERLGSVVDGGGGDGGGFGGQGLVVGEGDQAAIQ